MTKVTAQMSVSVDGFYAGPTDPKDPDDMAGWMDGPEAPGFFRVTRWAVDAAGWRERQGYAGGEQSIDSEIIEETFATAGRVRDGPAHVRRRRGAVGRRAAVPGAGVRRDPPAPRGARAQGGTSFTFVTAGVEQAIQLARAAADGKNVAVAGGDTLLRQVLRAGLLDELELHIVPVLLGDGLRLFDAGLGLADDEGIELTPLRVVDTPKLTHIRYAVNGRARLELDNRAETRTEEIR